MIKVSAIISYMKEIGLGYGFKGDKETAINGFSSLKNYKCGSMTWIKTEDSIPQGFALDSVAFAFVQEGINVSLANQIITKSSKRAFFSTIEHFFESKTERPSVGHGTYISPDVKLGKNVKIGYNCVLDGEIAIGDDTQIWDNVNIINKVTVGKNCIIQSGARIGHDGLGYYEDENHIKTMVRHYGGITIGNDVFIGPNSVVIRGTIDDTIIGNGCKIDSFCNVDHNCILSENITLITGTHLYGSVIIEKNAYLATSLIKNQLRIGANAFVGMGSIVIRDVEENTVVVGNPAKPLKR